MASTTLAHGESRVGIPLVVSTPARRVATGAALIGLACMLGLIEAAMPPLLVAPWLKLGLANIAVVIALAVADARTAVATSLGRLLIIGLATGTLAGPTTIIAAGGATASLVIMVTLARFHTAFSPIGWSAAGSAAHVVAQLLCASVLLGTNSFLAFAPLSVLLALALGVATGTLALTVVSRLSHVFAR